MARNRWTLALIIVCLPILATVITAFRVRDLPKSAVDSADKFTKPSVKDSAKSYEELKKAVREKQQLINQKTEAKSGAAFKIVSESETDDDDDDDLDVIKSKSEDKINANPKLSKVEKLPEPKNAKRLKQDDDDSHSKTIKVEEREKKIVVKIKIEPKKVVTKVQEKVKPPSKDDDDDEDDDDDDDDDDTSDLKKSTKKVEPKKNEPVKQDTTKVHLKEKVKHVVSHGSEDSDDDDDDDDDDDSGELRKPLLATKKDASKQAPKKTDTTDKPKPSKSIKEDSDDDDDDDDDEDSDLKSKKEVKQKTPVKLQKSETVDKSNPKKDTKDQKVEIKPKTIDSKADDKKSPTPSKQTHAESKSKTMDAKKLDPSKEKLSPLPKKDEVKSKVEAPKKDTHKEDPKKLKEPAKESAKSTPAPKVDEKKVEKKPEPKKDSKAEASKDKESKESGETGHKKEKEGKNKKEDSSEVKTSSHIDQLTEMLHRRNMLASEFEDFYAFLPTFAPNFSRIHNPECRRHGQILLRQLRGTKLWALNMLDASAKIPSGILQGNGIQLGDFDQCLGSRARVQLETGSVVKVQGKYCLARLDVKAEHQELEVPVHLAQAKNLIRSRIDDPGHFVPRFSTLSWGVCVPSPCHPEDAEVVIKDALKHYQHTSGLVVRVKIDERDCHTYESSWDQWLELPTVLTLSFYGIVILLVLLATVKDYLSSGKTEDGSNEDADADAADDKAECDQPEAEEGEKEKDTAKSADGFLSSFSLYRTIPKLTAPGSDDEISCIHGIRGLATIALLIAHKFLPVAVTPYNNRLKITEMVSSPLWSWCRAGWMYTDCFLLLSGALTAHRISAEGSGAPWRLFSRYLRLTPALLAVVLFYAFVWDNISTGPLWGTLVTRNAEICQEGWWWNILYVQNWFGFEDMCAPQTHQLALDMQLTIIGGMIVWVMHVKPMVAKILVPSVIAMAAYSRYSTVSEHRLTLLAYHGVSVSQLYRTARLSYTSVYHRCTPYLIGLILGLTLQKPSQLNKILSAIGWLSSSALWALVLWAGLDSGYTQYHYSATFAAKYAALAPIAASLAIAWVIYGVHNGHCEFLSDFLCCRPLVLISRLSYALYLCQFIVFLTEAATVRTTSEFSLMSLIDLQEISLIILSSTLLTLTFVIPMQSLHKVFTFSSSSEKGEDKEESEEKPEENHTEPNAPPTESEDQEEQIEVPQIKSRQHLVVHRELLEEIPEADIEYEVQRDKIEGLEEILEEEEEEAEEDEVRENHFDEEDMEVIEEEQGGEDDFWGDRDEDYVPRRVSRVQDDDDIDEWEWTANGSQNGAQQYRYTR